MGSLEARHPRCRHAALGRLHATQTPSPGVRYGSHPGSALSILGAAPDGRRDALL